MSLSINGINNDAEILATQNSYNKTINVDNSIKALFYYYDNDESNIKKHIYDVISLVFGEDNLQYFKSGSTFNITFTNILKEVAERLANWETLSINVGTRELYDYFESIKAVSFAKKAHELCRFANTLICHIMLMDNEVKLVYLREGDGVLQDVKFDNDGNVVGYSFKINKELIEIGFDGQNIATKTIGKNVESYGVNFLPCVIYQYSIPRVGFWGEPQSEFVEAQDRLNKVLNEYEYDADYNSFTERIITGATSNDVAGLSIGIGVQRSFSNPDAKYQKIDPSLSNENYTDRINMYLSMALQSVGIDPSRLSTTAISKVKSGIALLVEGDEEIQQKLKFQGTMIGYDNEFLKKLIYLET